MKWLLCFWPREKGQWWGRKFGHVSALGYDEASRTWILKDVERKGEKIRVAFAHDDVLDLLSYVHEHTTIVRPPDSTRGTAFFAPLTCVSAVQHLCGLPIRAVTPDGLYRTLLAAGAEVVCESPEDQGVERTEAGAAESRL